MTSVFNKSATLERMAFDAQLFREMVELMLADGPRRVQAIEAAWQDGDWPRVHQAAHSLKGLAANFSASRTVEAAAALEKLARAGNAAEAPAAIAELQAALRELLEELPLHAAPGAPAAAVSHRGPGRS